MRGSYNTIRLFPMLVSLLTIALLIFLICFCVTLYSGKSTEDDFDKAFINSINYHSLYDNYIPSSLYGDFMGNRLEIINLRRYLYDRVCKEYERPKRFIYRRYFYVEEQEYGFSAKYMIKGDKTIMFWDYGKTISEYSKDIGVDERIYWLDIHILPRSEKITESYY